MKTVQISLNSIDKVKAFVMKSANLTATLIWYPEDMSLTQNLSWVSSVWIFPNRSISTFTLMEAAWTL